jgi:dienelactone hydrolase
MRIFAMLLAALLFAACGGAAPPSDATAVTLKASDGTTIHGTAYAAPHPKALILLFHQAGSSKAEYDTIAPKLVAAGYSALAIDQRSGGALFGPNQTAANACPAKALCLEPTYLDAKPDLEAALRWGETRKLPIVLWGSSYSAALVFVVAAEHPEVKAVLAFSPGEYLGETYRGKTPPPRNMVARAASKVRAPIFVTSASDPREIAAARTILAASPARVKVQYVPKVGVHGSSTLIPARDPGGAAANWAPVLAFLGKVAG